jgi:predicted Zn-dependent protease
VAKHLARASRWSVAVCFVVVGLTLPGCGGGNYGGPGEGEAEGAGEGPGRRYQALALSAQQEVKLGDEAFQEVLQKERPVEGAPANRVRTVGEKIFHVALDNEPLRKEINLSDVDPYGRPWDFNDRKYAVLRENQVNAFCLPGGKVAVFTGLTDMTKGNDDWLATVLGHEIAHALAHHASERIARQQMDGQAVDASAGGLGLLDNDDRWKLMDLLGVGSHVLQYDDSRGRQSEGRHGGGLFGQIRELSFDRQQESEADHIGIFLMTFAGYDPRRSVDFWEAMEAQGAGKEPPEILSDHPSDAHRVALMKGWVVQAENALQAYKAGRIAPAAEH